MTLMKSLQARLLLGVMTVTVVAWIALALSAYFQSRHELDELLDAHLAQTADVLSLQLSEEFEETEPEHAQPLHRYARNVAFQVWEHGRQLRLHSVSAPPDKLSPVEQGFSFSKIDGKRWRVFSIWNHGKDALIQVAERVEARDEVSEEIAWNLLAPVFFVLPLLGFALALAIRKGLKPLKALAREVSGMDSRRLEHLQADQAPHEVRPLVTQLNALFDRIQESMENERRFTADASHELRTPIAAIRTQAQVAKKAQDEAERLHALDQVLTGCDRATHLTAQLLTLARLEGSQWSVPSRLVDLNEVARSVLAELGQLAYGKGIELELIAPTQGVAIHGDETLLRVLVRNLVDNSLNYSPSNTKITVCIQTTDSKARLEVTDQGPGIPEEERGRVLNRFYRILGTNQAGSGLGLSIVARIAQLHDASLYLSAGEDQAGLRVSLTFPRARAI